MLAGLLAAPRQIQLIDVPEPELPAAERAPGMILFQPEMTCLCGSDLPYFDGAFEGHPVEYPQLVGMSLHEMVGTVV
ncbi:MAG: alcohol dehydrogenase, partial [Planctomycetaceae bacterium]